MKRLPRWEPILALVTMTLRCQEPHDTKAWKPCLERSSASVKLQLFAGALLVGPAELVGSKPVDLAGASDLQVLVAKAELFSILCLANCSQQLPL